MTVDDNLFKRRGKQVFGAAWQHDGAATGAARRARDLLPVLAEMSSIRG